MTSYWPTVGQLKCILACHWLFRLYNYIDLSLVICIEWRHFFQGTLKSLMTDRPSNFDFICFLEWSLSKKILVHQPRKSYFRLTYGRTDKINRVAWLINYICVLYIIFILLNNAYNAKVRSKKKLIQRVLKYFISQVSSLLC